MSNKNSTTIEGQIERITFRNADTNFVIAKFRPKDHNNLITVLGYIPETQPGEQMRITGQWKQHPRYGQQLEITTFEVILPAEAEQIRHYLSSGLIKGIGAKTAERLSDHFSTQALEIIEKEPHRLSEIHGIGAEKAQRIHAAWLDHHQVRALMAYLQSNGVKTMYGARIYKTYGKEALSILQHDPYRVARDIPRIGFYIADSIVRHSDLPVDDSERAQACLLYLLEEAGEEGHLFIPRQPLMERCSTAFELDYHAVQTALDMLSEEGTITLCADAAEKPVYLTSLYQSETKIAQRIQAKMQIDVPPAMVDTTQILTTVVRRLAIHLSEAQLAALESVVHHRIVIITGGPGTGKTTLIRAISAVFEAIGTPYLLTAPTGRAARRMAEVTRKPAATLHKLLGFNLSEGGFERDQDDPLDTEALIIDEASMVDVVLMAHLMKALPLQARLILVGDVFQLPSVGPGTVLADLIEAQMIKTFELKEVFRQAAQSPIIANAHRIRIGQLPDLAPVGPSDRLQPFSFIEQETLPAVAETILELCTGRIQAQLGIDATQLQVLTPMHKGIVGTLNLNQQLQTALNPNCATTKAVGGRFYLSDRVMHLRNNYQKEVFNGEIGQIVALDLEEQQLVVDYDGRQVQYEATDLDELTLAYAITVHKSQGSEYPIVVLPMVTHHYVMLQRNLLYTALTRARQMVVIVGSVKAVRIAVAADQPKRRQSLLAWRLGAGDFVDSKLSTNQLSDSGDGFLSFSEGMGNLKKSTPS